MASFVGVAEGNAEVVIVGVRVEVGTIVCVGNGVIVGTNVDVDCAVAVGVLTENVGDAVMVGMTDGLAVGVDVLIGVLVAVADGVLDGNTVDVETNGVDVDVGEFDCLHFLFSSRSSRKSSNGLHGRSSMRIHLPCSFPSASYPFALRAMPLVLHGVWVAVMPLPVEGNWRCRVLDRRTRRADDLCNAGERERKDGKQGDD